MKAIVNPVILLITLLFHSLLWSQNTTKLEGYHYKELIVNASAKESNLPLIIALHWMRSNPDEFATYLKEIKSPARILLLEGNYPFKEGFSFFPTEPENYYKMNEDAKMKVLVKEGNKLAKFITAATKKYPSKKKPIIIGASQGGDLSYFIAIEYNSLIGLSCPLLATIDERLIIEGKPKPLALIHAFHGEDDPIVPVNTALHHIKTFQKKQFNAIITTFNGIKHDISEGMKKDFSAVIDSYLE